VTLDSDNSRGFPGKEVSYNSGEIENVFFFGLSDATYSALQEMKPTLIYSIIYSLIVSA